jgi:ribosomal protein S18 acetylase RimI-like enzyme
MPNSTIIRQALPDDAALVASMGTRTFVDSFGGSNRPEDIDEYVAVHFSMDQVSVELRDPATTFLLLFEHGAAIGYAKLVAGETPSTIRGPAPVELARIYLERDAIGKGHGAKLLHACLDTAGRKGFETIWLGVWDHNDRAIRFYERMDFRRAGELTFILGRQRQTDFVMERPVVRES